MNVNVPKLIEYCMMTKFLHLHYNFNKYGIIFTHYFHSKLTADIHIQTHN